MTTYDTLAEAAAAYRERDAPEVSRLLNSDEGLQYLCEAVLGLATLATALCVVDVIMEGEADDDVADTCRAMLLGIREPDQKDDAHRALHCLTHDQQHEVLSVLLEVVGDAQAIALEEYRQN